MPDPQHELHRNVFTGQRFDEDGLQGAVGGSVWSIDGPAIINNSSDTVFSSSTKATWSTLIVQNTNTDDNTGLGIALKGHDSYSGIAHITTAANKGRTSIISSDDAGATGKEALTVSPEGYIGIGHTSPTTALNPKGGLDTNFAGTVTTTGGKVTSITITTAGSGYTAGNLTFSGGGGTGATGTYTVSGTGAIATVTITNAGSGYTTPPSVFGSGATNGTLTAAVDSVVTVSAAHGIKKGDAVSIATGASSALENFTVSSVSNTTQFLVPQVSNHISSSPAATNKIDNEFVKIESGAGGSLLIIDKSGHIGIGGAPRTSLDVVSTDAIIIPTGTPNQAPGESASQIGTAVKGMIRFDSDGNAFKGYDGSTWITMAVSGVTDSDGDTKINPEVTLDADDLVFYTDGTIRMQIDQDGTFTYPDGSFRVGADTDGYDVKFFGNSTGKYMLWDESADELVLAGDSKLSFHDAAGGENIIASSNGHLEVNAGTTLDITAPTVDINAATLVQIDGPVSVGVNDTGHDVKFFGATSGAYMLWDESDNSLETVGAATINVVKDKLLIGGTAVTTTAAELNIMDGDTSATGTTLLDADRVVVNDAGTMKQVAMSDFETFMESNLDTLSSVTTVGALNSGSITSGFGSIDVGSSAITTTGTVTSTGSLVIPVSSGVPSLSSTNGQVSLGYSQYFYLYCRFHDGVTRKVQLT